MSADTFLAGNLVIAGVVLAAGAWWAGREADRTAAARATRPIAAAAAAEPPGAWSSPAADRALVEHAYAIALDHARRASTRRLAQREHQLRHDYGYGRVIVDELVVLAATRTALVERGVPVPALPHGPTTAAGEARR